MHPTLALLLQAGIVLVGFVVLGLLLIEPHFEGRNAHATVFEVYFHDPFLAYVYIGSIPFFVALRRAFRLLGEVRRTGAFSEDSVDGLRAIKRCALAVLGFLAGAMVIIVIIADHDDRPAGVVMCTVAALATGLAAFAAATLARALQRTLHDSGGSRV